MQQCFALLFWEDQIVHTGCLQLTTGMWTFADSAGHCAMRTVSVKQLREVVGWETKLTNLSLYGLFSSITPTGGIGWGHNFTLFILKKYWSLLLYWPIRFFWGDKGRFLMCVGILLLWLLKVLCVFTLDSCSIVLDECNVTEDDDEDQEVWVVGKTWHIIWRMPCRAWLKAYSSSVILRHYSGLVLLTDMDIRSEIFP